MATEKYTPRLKDEYHARIRQVMKEKFGYTNEMQVPKLDKIVLNMGIGEAVADSKKANTALKDLTAIAGQKAVATKARNSIAGFKLREGMVIGGKVTLRGDQMYEFLDRFITIALPRVKDSYECLGPSGRRGNRTYGMVPRRSRAASHAARRHRLWLLRSQDDLRHHRREGLGL